MKRIQMQAVFFAVAMGAAGVAVGEIDRRPVSQGDLENVQYRTINGQSIEGTGNIEISGGEDYLNAQDVTKFGATGDGVTDDTAAVRAAMAAGKVVYFPHNGGHDTYLLSETMILGDACLFKGDPGVTLTTPGTVLVVSGRGAGVETLTLKATAGVALLVTGTNVTVRHVFVPKAPVNGIVVRNASQVWIENGAITEAEGTGLAIEGLSASVVVRNVSFTSNKGIGLSFGEATRLVSVDGNQFTSNPTAISGAGTDATIANNTILGCTDYGVRLAGAARANVSGNAFARCGGSVVTFRADGVVDSVLANNTFGNYGVAQTYTGTNAILIDDGTNLVVRGNTVDRQYSVEKPQGTATGTVNVTVRNSKNVNVTANACTQSIIDISTGNENVVKSANLEAEQ